MKIHREGKPTLIALSLSFGPLLVVLGLYGHPASFYGALAVSLPALVFFLQFFRAPARRIPADADGCVMAPADGKVVVIEKTYEPEFFQEERLQLSIFMSPFDVHLNRAPVSGRVLRYRYHPGKYLMAFNPKSSTQNERNTIVLEDQAGTKVLMRQIAGFAARRIVFYPSEGDELRQGQELGFIKFGSRVDLFLPLDTQVKVQVGEQVRSGEKVLATYRPAPARNPSATGAQAASGSASASP
jgi:phosphatidylserine decarboxylase